MRVLSASARYGGVVTWVIGIPSPFGYAAAIADVQVSWGDGRTQDCLQKIHRVGPSLVLGFSGSVKLGFMMCASLARFLHPSPPDGHNWEPCSVAERWQPQAAKAFRLAEGLEKQLGCSLVLLGVHPNQDVGVDGWARSYAIRMQHPGFVPEQHGVGVVSIGSGSQIGAYVKKLNEITADDTRFPYFQSQMMGPAGYADAILGALTRAIEAEPAAGISPHLHIVVVTRHHVGIGTNDYEIITPPGRKFRMPMVATTWEEFQRIRTFADALGALA